MSLADTIRLVLARPHPAGRVFIWAGAGVAVVGGLVLGAWLFWLAAAFTLFCLYFFRDPERFPPTGRNLVVAPADGRVVSVAPAVPPVELGRSRAASPASPIATAPSSTRRSTRPAKTMSATRWPSAPATGATWAWCRSLA
jgi:phosphatidylserine decarboxylase